MSILAKSEILKEIEGGRIKIDPFDPSCVGPASVDLHLADVFRVFKSLRRPVPVTEECHYKEVTEGVRIPLGGKLLLMPGETVLGMTAEKISLPDDICGWLEGRSRFARMGLLVHISASFMQPGIANHQVLEMSNFGPFPLEIVPGTAVCQFVFQRTSGRGAYRGASPNRPPDLFLSDLNERERNGPPEGGR